MISHPKLDLVLISAAGFLRSFGVTGVCSGRNASMVRSIGADHVIDYTRQDFTRIGKRYDLIFDCVSNHSLAEYRRVLAHQRICVMAGDLTGRGTGGMIWRLVSALVLSRFTLEKFSPFLA